MHIVVIPLVLTSGSALHALCIVFCGQGPRGQTPACRASNKLYLAFGSHIPKKDQKKKVPNPYSLSAHRRKRVCHKRMVVRSLFCYTNQDMVAFDRQLSLISQNSIYPNNGYLI